MKPHPRIRKTIKWGGAALTVLLVVVWIASGWYSLQWFSSTQDNWVTLRSGCLFIGITTHPPQIFAGWYFTTSETPGTIEWFGAWDEVSWDRLWFKIPLWLPFVISLTVTALAFRLDTLARRSSNMCRKCHYDRTGLAAGAVCPECGTGSSTA